MLGTLTRYLRMCGYDAGYAGDRGIVDDDALLGTADAEDRRVVTRDVDLAARSDDALLIEGREIDGQLTELRDDGFELSLTRPERCGRCNGRLEPVDPGESTPAYAPAPDERSVWRCPECGQYFWRGSHWDDVADRLARL